MKFVFALFLSITDQTTGEVTTKQLNDVTYKDKFECMVAKAQHRDDMLFKFECKPLKKD